MTIATCIGNALLTPEGGRLMLHTALGTFVPPARLIPLYVIMIDNHSWMRSIIHEGIIGYVRCRSQESRGSYRQLGMRTDDDIRLFNIVNSIQRVRLLYIVTVAVIYLLLFLRLSGQSWLLKANYQSTRVNYTSSSRQPTSCD